MTIEVTCTRCRGTGRIDCFRHVEAGVCFRCQGKGYKLAKSGVARTSSVQPKNDAHVAAFEAAIPVFGHFAHIFTFMNAVDQIPF